VRRWHKTPGAYIELHTDLTEQAAQITALSRDPRRFFLTSQILVDCRGMRWLAVALLLGSAAPAFADDDDAIIAREPPPKTPFDRGRMTLTIGGGTQSYLGNHYIVLGAGFGYFVLDGVELGAAAVEHIGDPNIFQVTPSLRYIAKPLVGKSPLVPYVGGFYNHWFISSGVADVDSVGARGGLIYVSGSILLGLGVAYERIVSTCATDCSSIYPDLTIALAL
jgi:hypothetical protein